MQITVLRASNLQLVSYIFHATSKYSSKTDQYIAVAMANVTDKGARMSAASFINYLALVSLCVLGGVYMALPARELTADEKRYAEERATAKAAEERMIKNIARNYDNCGAALCPSEPSGAVVIFGVAR